MVCCFPSNGSSHRVLPSYFPPMDSNGKVSMSLQCTVIAHHSTNRTMPCYTLDCCHRCDGLCLLASQPLDPRTYSNLFWRINQVRLPVERVQCMCPPVLSYSGLTKCASHTACSGIRINFIAYSRAIIIIASLMRSNHGGNSFGGLAIASLCQQTTHSVSSPTRTVR